MKDYRLTIRVRNNRLLKAIEAGGWVLGKKWCDANGLSYGRVNGLVNMTTSPLMSDGRLYPDAARLCDVLGKLPEDLWSNEQLYPLEKNFSEMEMDHGQVVAMLPSEQQSYPPDFSEIEQKQARALLQKAMRSLSLNGQEVIRYRYEDDLTLEQCAKRMGLTKERIRQIEARAIRCLQKPACIALLADAAPEGHKVVVLKEHRIRKAGEISV